MAGQSQRLLGHDEEQLVIRPSSKTRSCFQLFRSWFGSFSLGVVATLLIMSIWQHVPSSREAYRYAKTDALPDVPYEIRMFEADSLYSSRPSDDTDFAWNMLLPNGRGYVFVSDSKDRGLLPGEMTEHGEIYSVSMFHQLHCLARMRTMHWIMLDGVASGDLNLARQFTGRDAAEHIQHCLDYLRQSIFCAGDMTLEWPKQEGSSSLAKVDGWNIPHKCKKRSAIDAFMEQYHFNGSMNFDAAG